MDICDRIAIRTLGDRNITETQRQSSDIKTEKKIYIHAYTYTNTPTMIYFNIHYYLLIYEF